VKPAAFFGLVRAAGSVVLSFGLGLRELCLKEVYLPIVRPFDDAARQCELERHARLDMGQFTVPHVV
jgi:hypothetical protein